MKKLSRNNHFIPKFYLKNWGSDNKVWATQLLVPNCNFPIWRQESISVTAVHKNLYVRTDSQKETDEFESWFNEVFETPVQEAFLKAVDDERLSPEDWRRIIDFLASMSMRTPAQFVRAHSNLKKILPDILEKFVDDFSKKTENEIINEDELNYFQHKLNETYFPIKIEVDSNSIGINDTKVAVGLRVGKGLLLWLMKHILTNTAEILHKHHWSIISIAEGMSWATTDDPVLCINYYGKDNYDFGGGWNNEGSEIIFPISPTRALYAQVGRKHPRRFIFDDIKSRDVQKMIICHAHRKIYSCLPDPDIKILRPRKVDLEIYKDEATQWEKFHQDHLEIDKDYYRDRES